MRVALTMRITAAETYTERRDSISHDWLARLVSWQMVPVLVPNVLNDPSAFLSVLKPDLLVLTGGDNLGATPQRDQMENILLKHAIENGMPVLGVCRGLQLINAFFDGTTIPVTHHAATEHQVRFSTGWKKIYGRCAQVNSYHANGVKDEVVGKQLIVTARDDNGLVEAFQHEFLPLAAVMWHPERGSACQADKVMIEALCARELSPE